MKKPGDTVLLFYFSSDNLNLVDCPRRTTPRQPVINPYCGWVEASDQTPTPKMQPIPGSQLTIIDGRGPSEDCDG